MYSWGLAVKRCDVICSTLCEQPALCLIALGVNGFR
jgi:hypothetical protein